MEAEGGGGRWRRKVEADGGGGGGRWRRRRTVEAEADGRGEGRRSSYRHFDDQLTLALREFFANELDGFCEMCDSVVLFDVCAHHNIKWGCNQFNLNFKISK